MSYCGFVTFSSAPTAVAAESAMRRWTAASAASATEYAWTSTDARGYFCTLSLAAGTDHHAEIVRDARHPFVGDAPRTWLSDPGAHDRLTRLAASSISGTGALIPDGDFSMGVWSAAESRLTLYRCPLGTRAMLYVCEPGAWIAFASLPEPLLALPDVRGAIDEEALPSQLILGYSGSPTSGATLFARLRRLPGGHALRFTRDATTVEEYWRLPVDVPRKFGANDPEVPRELRRRMNAAVHRRVAGVQAIGTQLSGGLDSSVVSALAHAQRDPDSRVFAYTIRSHDESGVLVSQEEHRLARALLSRLDGVVPRSIIHHKAHRPFYAYQREYLQRPLPDMVFKFGPDHRLLAEARADGCDVMLTGWGGDHMASARGHLHVLAMIAEWRWALAIENLLDESRTSGLLRSVKRSVMGPLWRAYRSVPAWPDADRDQLRAIVNGTRLEQPLSTRWHRREDWSIRRSRRDHLGRVHFQIALELQDWLGQRAGIPVYHPLLDRGVIEFCDQMPAEWIGHLGVTRRALKAATADLVPAEAIERVKAPLAKPADNPRWRRRYQAHDARLLHDLARSETPLHEFLNLSLLARIVSERARRADNEWSPIQQLGASVLTIARTIHSS
ncbi:MAG TPA: asparagine synthase-related protein [Gemmatimonadaceae bacterium]|nr:asparagine synthase-related protein [Gemmatimonadaceae bacterium]